MCVFGIPPVWPQRHCPVVAEEVLEPVRYAPTDGVFDGGVDVAESPQTLQNISGVETVDKAQVRPDAVGETPITILGRQRSLHRPLDESLHMGVLGKRLCRRP